MADDEYENEDGTDLVPRAHIRQLEEKAKKAAELETRLATMERETAFAKALGSTDHPGRSYFEKGYDGPLEVEAIREAAKTAGFLSTAPPPPVPTDNLNADLSGHARMATNVVGADEATAANWHDALAEADRIPNEAEREAAILSVVERFGGVTSRTAQ